MLSEHGAQDPQANAHPIGFGHGGEPKVSDIGHEGSFI
jgi:hypothetical protein